MALNSIYILLAVYSVVILNIFYVTIAKKKIVVSGFFWHRRKWKKYNNFFEKINLTQSYKLLIQEWNRLACFRVFFLLHLKMLIFRLNNAFFTGFPYMNKKKKYRQWTCQVNFKWIMILLFKMEKLYWQLTWL